MHRAAAGGNRPGIQAAANGAILPAPMAELAATKPQAGRARRSGPSRTGSRDQGVLNRHPRRQGPATATATAA